MKITPQTAPSGEISNSTPSQAQLSARDRAIAKLSSQTTASAQVQETPPEVAMAMAAANKSQPIETPKETTEVQGQTNPDEVPPKETSTVVTEDKPLSPQYAAIARKERALRDQKRQFDAERQAFKSEQEAAKAKQTQEQNGFVSKDKLVKDPWSVLNEAGITYDQLTNQALNPPSEQDRLIQEMRAEIQELKVATKQVNTNIEQRDSQAYNQAVAQIRTDVANLVKADPNFETIKETRSVNDVVQLIEQTFKQDGVLLSIEEAAQAVEDHLIEEAMKITKIKKIQQRLAPPTQQKPKAESKSNEQTQPQLKTLTNAVGSTRPLSNKERAIAVMEGRLAPSYRK